ncbi:hypothetical protein EK904_005813 [Melospiza melodia maxima]|nr:hypothetical protein EK904_005813 [Melospiza melodia maxima]
MVLCYENVKQECSDPSQVPARQQTPRQQNCMRNSERAVLYIMPPGISVFKLQMPMSIQKLIKMQLMKASHLYAKQAFPRWAALM